VSRIGNVLENRRAMALALPALAIGAGAVPAQGVSLRALQVVWSAPITIEAVPPPQVGTVSNIRPREDGISLRQSVDRQGRITFLAKRFDFASTDDVLLEGFERNGFQKPTRIRLKGAQTDSVPARVLGMKVNPYPGTAAIESMTIDNEGMVWVGGATGFYTGIASDPHSLAYLARLDKAGVPIWERSYKVGNMAGAVSMTPTATTNVLVAAYDGWSEPSWLAMIAARDGGVVWERHLGNGAGVAVAAVGNAFLVATFDATGTGSTYQEDVVVRRVNAEGQVGPPGVVRSAINRQRGSRYGRVGMSPTDDGAYVVSSWQVAYAQNPKPAEIAKVDADGRLVWKATIPTSFVANPDGVGVTFCDGPAVATLPDGDSLVACALKGHIHTHRFNRLTGKDRQANFPLPACNDAEDSVALSLFVRPDGQVLVSGTRPGGNVGPGCSWLARLPAEGT
jgi:hypothetical protein